MEETKVDLGFADDCEAWLLTNKFFPSKIGGKPAWLELKNLPKAIDLECKMCKQPLLFLLQVYASNDQKECCFHRTIYVFVCNNQDCYKANDSSAIQVFRSQLPRTNPYYDFEPPNEHVESGPVPTLEQLCRICGSHAFAQCSKCKKVYYCSVSHQKIDWKGRHKKECLEGITVPDWKNNLLFCEYELVIEQEVLEKKVKETEKTIEERGMKQYEELLKKGEAGTLSDLPITELDKYSGDTQVDKTFFKFKERISTNKDQVIRYERGGEPLWISTKFQITSDQIPTCESCGGKRDFEFQVMPQLLNKLKNDSIDWGVIAIYTCANDCDIGQKYFQEYAYKQDIVEETLL